MRRFFLLFSCCILNLSSSNAWAWNDVGHMTIARIAYEKLTDGERASVVEILRHHPHVQELLLKGRPDQVSKSEWIFLRAATWPDAVRPPRDHARAPVAVHPIYRFHHPTWHYANFEYRSGQSASALPDRPLPPTSVPSHGVANTNIIEQLDHSYLIVRGKEREYSEPEIEFSPAEIRAIRMCWLFHLVGDIHQPLHVATLVNPQIPLLQHGDEGGNKLAVRLNHNSAPKKLHSVWDELLGTNARYENIVNLSERISHDPHLTPMRLAEFSHQRYAWEFAQESYQVAKQVAYQNGKLHFALWSRVETGEVPVEVVPTMSQDALSQAHAFAERRIALAGYRLAERLKFIVQTSVESASTTNVVPNSRFR